jgi:hypothetical protein
VRGWNITPIGDGKSSQDAQERTDGPTGLDLDGTLPPELFGPGN